MTDLIHTYRETVHYFKKNHVPNLTPSVRLDINQITVKSYPPCKQLQIIIRNIDSFDMARQFVTASSGFMKPLVLNMASDQEPGGGVLRGAKAQEEDLFRKSNYFEVLEPQWYPLNKHTIVYSPRVYIARDSEYNWLPELVPVSCLAVAAPYAPESYLDATGCERYANPEDYELMRRKIHAIFKTGIMYGHDALILGALGCGAYFNPRHDVAEIFKQCIQMYGSYFKVIAFAILAKGNPNDFRADSNFNIFNNILLK